MLEGATAHARLEHIAAHLVQSGEYLMGQQHGVQDFDHHVWRAFHEHVHGAQGALDGVRREMGHQVAVHVAWVLASGADLRQSAQIVMVRAVCNRRSGDALHSWSGDLAPTPFA